MGRARKVDVINDKRSARGRNVSDLAEGCRYAYGCTNEGTVLEKDRANGLVRASSRHIDSDSTIVRCQGFESPQPVPVHEDARLYASAGDISCGELLVSKEGTVLTAIECQIGHESTRTVVHEDSNLFACSRVDHVDLDVLETCRLSHLPMDASSSGLGHLGEIDVEISNLEKVRMQHERRGESAHLTEEVVLICVPVNSICVWV